MAEELQVRIGADATDLVRESKRAERAFDRFTDSIEQSAQQISDAARSAEDGFDNMARSVDQATKQVSRSTGRARDALGRFVSAADQAGDATEDAAKSTDKARDALGRFVRASDRAQQEAKESATAFDRLRKSVNNAGSKVRDFASDLGSVAGGPAVAGLNLIQRGIEGLVKGAAAAGVALAGVGTAAAISFARFEDAFAQVRTLVDESQVDVEALADGVRGLSRRFGVDVIEATEAAYQAISAGQEPARVLEFLEEAFTGAAAGATSTSEAVDLFTTALNAYGKGADEAQAVSDVLFATIKAGKTDATQLAASLGQVAPVAAAAGVQLTEVGAALATLTASGLSTAQSATALKATLVGILKPTEQAAVAFSRIGVSAESLRESGLIETIARVRQGIREGQGSITDFFPAVEALTGVATLAGTGFDKLTESLEATTNAAGNSAEAFAKVEKTTGFAFARLRRTVEDTLREAGQAIDPFVSRGLGAFNTFAENARSEVELLGNVLSRRFAPLVEEVFQRLEGSADRSGMIASDALRAIADGIDFVADRVRDARPVIATLATTFETVADAVTFLVNSIRTGFGAILTTASRQIADLIGVAEKLADTLGLEVADSLREAKQTAEDFFESFTKETIRSARATARSFEDLIDVDSTFDAASKAVNKFGIEASKAADSVRDLAQDVDAERINELAEATGKAADAAGALDGASRTGAEGQDELGDAAERARIELTRFDTAATASKTTAELMAEALKRAGLASHDLTTGTRESAQALSGLTAAAGSSATAAAALSRSVDMASSGFTNVAMVTNSATSAFDQIKAAIRGTSQDLSALTGSGAAAAASVGTFSSSVEQATPKVQQIAGAMERMRAEQDQTREGLVLLSTVLQGEFQQAGDQAAASLARQEISAQSFRQEIEKLVAAQRQVTLGLTELLSPLSDLGSGFRSLTELAGQTRSEIAGRLRDGFENFRKTLVGTDQDASKLVESVRELGRVQGELSSVNDVTILAFDKASQSSDRLAESILDTARNVDGELRPQLDALLEAFVRLDDFGVEELRKGLEQLNRESGRFVELSINDFTLSFAQGLQQVANAADQAAEGVARLEQAARSAQRVGTSLGLLSGQRSGGETQAQVNERFSGFSFGIQPGKSVGKTTIGPGVFQDGGDVLQTGRPQVEAGEFILSQRGLTDLGRLLGDLLNRGRAESVVNMTNNFSLGGLSSVEGSDSINELAFKLSPALDRVGRLAAGRSPVR